MLKKGDKVVMHTCLEAELPKYKDKVWTCETDEFTACSGAQVVFLEGFSGYFAAEFLKKIEEERTMKYFEIHTPYYALLKAGTPEEAIAKFVECVADDDGTLHEEIQEVDRDYALVKFASGGVEGGEKMSIKEMLETFKEATPEVLCIDSALL